MKNRLFSRATVSSLFGTSLPALPALPAFPALSALSAFRFAFVSAFLFLLTACTPSYYMGEVALDSQWKFTTGDDMQWAEPQFDDSAWGTISCATPWESQGYPEYNGWGWYRQSFSIPAEMHSAINHFGGLVIQYDNCDDAEAFYFNGTLIATTGELPPHYMSGYGKKRCHIITPDLIHFDGPNTIAIRVFDGGGGGGLLTPDVTFRSVSLSEQIAVDIVMAQDNWVLMEGDAQEIRLKMTNNTGKRMKATLVFSIMTDKRVPLDSLSKPITIAKKGISEAVIPLSLPGPGFYRCRLKLSSPAAYFEPRSFNIGFEPEKIVSPMDRQPDFEAFWQAARRDLDRVPMKAKMTLLEDRSTGARNIYYVEMRSLGNEVMGGYYAVPKAGRGTFPVIISYMGYGSDAWFPHTDGNPGFAEFVTSVRGQGIFKPNNKYNGNWIAWNLEDKDNYYYRGAFMDLIRAIDFVCSRPEIDTTRIVAEGGSQGGAFTMAACALDKRIKAAAPSVPFLSDYRDYFEIVGWPYSDIAAYMKAHPDAQWDHVYEVLSYFDIKNLAPWISCPLFMCAGLQDETCPPHTNFSGYNLVSSEKQYRIYKDQGHSTPVEWETLRMDFYKKHLDL